MTRSSKQPTKCDKCGSNLTNGEFGKGFCPNCKTYVMIISVDFEGLCL